MTNRRTMGPWAQDDRGVAMITALLVTFVVMLLGASVITLSIHNGETSSYDRRRLIAVNAAEAGIDDYWVHLASSTPSTIQCSRSGVITSGPAEGTWSSSIVLYNAAGAVVACPPASGTIPAAALITSDGQSPNGTLLRKMQSYIRLTPVYGGFDAAILATSTTTINNNVTITGDEGDDGDIYVSCPSSPCSLTMNNNENIDGNVYVQGSLTMNNSTTVQGDVWATGTITLTGSAVVQGDAISSTGSISVSSGATIQGSGTAAGTVVDAARVLGGAVAGVTSPSPPAKTLPQLTFDATQQTAWQTATYEVKTFADCATAKTFILAIPTGANIYGSKNYVVRITAVCLLNFSNNTTISLPGSLAIVTDGSVSMTQRVIWQATQDSNLYLISRYRTGLACGSAPGPYDISTSNNADFLNLAESPILNVLLYSPCAVNLWNQSLFNGQVFATYVNIQNQTNVNFTPVLVPGVAQVTGFRGDPQYLREVE